MVDSARAARLAQQIKVVVAQALRKRVKDPVAELITITECRVTGDLQQATLYYTVMGDEDQQREAMQVLRDSRGLLRYEVGHHVTTRLTPTLEFVRDEVPENAHHMEELIEGAKKRDAVLAAQAENAQYAGEPDPYKHADDEELDR